MYKKFRIEPPFFEMGPKAYYYGPEMLDFSKAIDSACKKYDVRVILTPQYTDIPTIARETENVFVFAQHMDSLPVGRGQGAVLPEAVKAAGAVGVILNHSEKPVCISEINKTIKRADSLGLASMVCADTIEEAAAIAHLAPNIIVVEQPELIGTGKIGDMEYIRRSIEVIHSINPEIQILNAAGISSADDVYRIIKAGAMATGSSSAIFKAGDPITMAEEMLRAVRMAWDELTGGKEI
jgi:triosephosphate isomerase